MIYIQLTLKWITKFNPDIWPALGAFITSGPHSNHGVILIQITCDRWQVIITKWHYGNDLQSPMLTHTWEKKLISQIFTCQACIQQCTQVGHVNPTITTVNHCAIHEIHGRNLVQLAMCCTANQIATTDKILAHKIKGICFQHSLVTSIFPFKTETYERFGGDNDLGMFNKYFRHLDFGNEFITKWELIDFVEK